MPLECLTGGVSVVMHISSGSKTSVVSHSASDKRLSPPIQLQRQRTNEMWRVKMAPGKWSKAGSTNGDNSSVMWHWQRAFDRGMTRAIQGVDRRKWQVDGCINKRTDSHRNNKKISDKVETWNKIHFKQWHPILKKIFIFLNMMRLNEFSNQSLLLTSSVLVYRGLRMSDYKKIILFITDKLLQPWLSERHLILWEKNNHLLLCRKKKKSLL